MYGGVFLHPDGDLDETTHDDLAYYIRSLLLGLPAMGREEGSMNAKTIRHTDELHNVPCQASSQPNR